MDSKAPVLEVSSINYTPSFIICSIHFTFDTIMIDRFRQNRIHLNY